MIKRPTYEEYDEYIIDYDTKNASFIMMASILRRKGIKNYNFFLKLYDEDLVGVNPYDPNLSAKMKFKIILECKRNFWYFIREVMIIPGTGHYQLHRGNLALSWCCVNNIPVYEVLPRQHGKTWAVIAYALWAFNYSTSYCSFLFMNKQLPDSQLNISRLKKARAELPDYLRNDKVTTSKGELRDSPSNVNKISNALNNEIYAKASARNPIAADELGRGMTVAWVWIDEVAFLQFNRIIYAAMAPAWSKAAQIAREKGKPIGKILTTTPSDLSGDAGQFAYEIRQDAAQFDETLYNMDSDEINTWMDKNSKNGYIYIEFSYLQLGHRDPTGWFNEQCKELLFDWAKIRREILLQWSNASSNSPFDEEDLRNLHAMIKQENENESLIINKYYKLNVYKRLDVSKKYIIAVDPSKGRGAKADRTAVVVIDAETDECCAIFKSPVIQYKETFRFIYTLFNTYIPNSVIVIENNIDTVIEYVKNSTMRFALYYESAVNVTHDKKKNGTLQKANNDNIVYGLTTSNDNRPKYFDILFEMVHREKALICARELVEEIETLEYKTPTRIEAVSSAHDDVVMAYLIGVYVKRCGRNRARFGIFYSDGLEKKQTQVSPDVFRSPLEERQNDENKLSGYSADIKNPFWSELLDDGDDDDTLDAKWQARQNNSGRKIPIDDVFSGKKDASGVQNISKRAFYDLNARESKMNRSVDDDDDTPWF